MNGTVQFEFHDSSPPLFNPEPTADRIHAVQDRHCVVVVIGDAESHIFNTIKPLIISGHC